MLKEICEFWIWSDFTICVRNCSSGKPISFSYIDLNPKLHAGKYGLPQGLRQTSTIPSHTFYSFNFFHFNSILQFPSHTFYIRSISFTQTEYSIFKNLWNSSPTWRMYLLPKQKAFILTKTPLSSIGSQICRLRTVSCLSCVHYSISTHCYDYKVDHKIEDHKM